MVGDLISLLIYSFEYDKYLKQVKVVSQLEKNILGGHENFRKIKGLAWSKDEVKAFFLHSR